MRRIWWAAVAMACVGCGGAGAPQSTTARQAVDSGVEAGVDADGVGDAPQPESGLTVIDSGSSGTDSAAIDSSALADAPVHGDADADAGAASDSDVTHDTGAERDASPDVVTEVDSGVAAMDAASPDAGSDAPSGNCFPKSATCCYGDSIPCCCYQTPPGEWGQVCAQPLMYGGTCEQIHCVTPAANGAACPP